MSTEPDSPTDDAAHQAAHYRAMLAKAETLTEALPYLQRYAGKTFVVKYGGHAMGDPELAQDFAEDIVLLKAVGINPVVVHGGGPQIGRMLKALGAARLFLLTDVPGVLDKDRQLLTDLTPADIQRLAEDGTISGGMIPKLETCVHAVEAGCEAAVVLDGRVPHAMLIEVFTARGAGTLIRA